MGRAYEEEAGPAGWRWGLRGRSGALGRGLWVGGGAAFRSREARSSLRGSLLQSSAVLDPISFCLTGLSSLIHFVSRTRQWGRNYQ